MLSSWLFGISVKVVEFVLFASYLISIVAWGTAFMECITSAVAVLLPTSEQIQTSEP